MLPSNAKFFGNRFWDLVNMPWVWVPLWLRAFRVREHRRRLDDAAHIEWAHSLVESVYGEQWGRWTRLNVYQARNEMLYHTALRKG